MQKTAALYISSNSKNAYFYSTETSYFHRQNIAIRAVQHTVGNGT